MKSISRIALALALVTIGLSSCEKNEVLTPQDAENFHIKTTEDTSNTKATTGGG